MGVLMTAIDSDSARFAAMLERWLELARTEYGEEKPDEEQIRAAETERALKLAHALDRAGDVIPVQERDLPYLRILLSSYPEAGLNIVDLT